MNPPVHILLLEDSEADAELVERALRRPGSECTVRRVVNEAQFRAAIAEGWAHAVIADYNVPGFRGDTALAVARALSTEIPFLFVSGTIGEELAVTLMKAGATDYVLKDRLERLPLALDRALHEADLRRAGQKAEEAARRSNETLALALEASNLGTWDWDTTTGELQWSEQCKAIFGIPAGEPMNYGRFLRALHPEDRRRADAAVTRALAEQAPYEIEFRTQWPDGSIHWVASKGRAFYDPQTGRPVRMLGTARDITTSKRDERALHESRERFASLVDTVQGIVWECEPATFRFTYVSRQAERLLGYPAARWCGEPGFWAEHIHPEDRDWVMDFCRDTLEMAENREFEYRMIAADGRTVWLRDLVTSVIEDGRLVLLRGVMVDVTDRRAAESALREADRRKDEFLAMLGHELRNPLSAIANAAKMIREGRTEPGACDWAQGIIERQTANLSRIVDDLLDVSRITRGQITLRKQVLDVGRIITRAAETVRPLIEEKRHELRVSLSPGDRIRVEADPTRLEQILVNVLMNAARYTREEGLIEIIERSHGDDVIIAVRDNGIGIDAALLSRIFELFTQADTSLARASGGLGIGLNICRQLVELHGGTIVAHSEGLGLGAEFTIRLPAVSCEEPSVAQAPPAEEARAERPKLRVLVVDDNIDTVRTLARLLSRRGHEVCTAYDGPGAERAAHEFKPDVLLLDLGLPGFDGFELARRLRGGGFAGNPMIAISGYAQESDLRRSREAGFDHHLAKPVDFEELMHLVEHPDRVAACSAPPCSPSRAKCGRG